MLPRLTASIRACRTRVMDLIARVRFHSHRTLPRQGGECLRATWQSLVPGLQLLDVPGLFGGVFLDEVHVPVALHFKEGERATNLDMRIAGPRRRADQQRNLLEGFHR